jgi:hypothetical protein
MGIIKYLDNKGLSYLWQKVKNAIPVLFSTTTETIKEEDKKDNSIGFVEDTNQIIYNNKYYGSGFFIGTKSEYDEAYKSGRIVNGTIVIIIEEEKPVEPSEPTEPSTSGELAILGTAILGKMILGKEK